MAVLLRSLVGGGGDLPMKNTDGVAIDQFFVVCFDSRNAAGFVLLGNTGANNIAGVNQSSGIDSAGAQSNQVQVGQSGDVRRAGGTRVVTTNVQINPGDKIYTTSALAGKVTPTSAGGTFVGYATEGNSATDGDVIGADLNLGGA